jgi:hypothetical protein
VRICYDVIVIWWRRPLYHHQEDINVYFNAVPVSIRRRKTQTWLTQGSSLVRFVCLHTVRRELALVRNSGCCYPRFVRWGRGEGQTSSGSGYSKYKDELLQVSRLTENIFSRDNSEQTP